MSEYRIMTQQRTGTQGAAYVPRVFGGTLVLPASIQALAQHVPCRLYPVSVPIELMAQGSIPVDIFDLYTDWLTLDIRRGDYFIDEATQAKYSVYGRPQAYTSHLWCRVTIPTGVTP